MTSTQCSRADTVERAVRDDRWTDDLRRHVDSCPACSDIVQVASYFARSESRVVDDAPLPDPSIVWIRAQLLARRDAARRAARAINILQYAAVAAAGLLGVFLMTILWPRLAGWAEHLARQSGDAVNPAEFGSPELVIIASVGVILYLVLRDAADGLAAR